MIVPFDITQPLSIVEFQLTKGENIHIRVVKAMVLAQEKDYAAQRGSDGKNIPINGALRNICGVIFMGRDVKRYPSPPWDQWIKVMIFEDVMAEFTKKNPLHPLSHVFVPILEKDNELLAKEAPAHYHALRESGEHLEAEAVLLEVFVDLFWQRFPKMTKKEIKMIFYDPTFNYRDTVMGREFLEEGKQHLLFRQLEAKFGVLSEKEKADIEKLSPEQLENLAVDLLFMNHPGELLHWLEKLAEVKM